MFTDKGCVTIMHCVARNCSGRQWFCWKQDDSYHVLSAKVIENVRVPSYSEIEILKGCTPNESNCYMLESNLQNSDILIARALVTPNELVPVCLLRSQLFLYSRANVAVMSEIFEVKDNDLVGKNI